jgi:hypothetical protein
MHAVRQVQARPVLASFTADADRATASGPRTAPRPFALDALTWTLLRPTMQLGPRIDRVAFSALAFPQVTASAAGYKKIVKVFEFNPLSCAPSRIRTCAHGSGGRWYSGR